MSMYCDDQVAINIASNYVFHDKTKRTEIGCHLKLQSKEICTKFVNSNDYFKYFDLVLERSSNSGYMFQLGTYNWYALAWKECQYYVTYLEQVNLFEQANFCIVSYLTCMVGLIITFFCIFDVRNSSK